MKCLVTVVWCIGLQRIQSSFPLWKTLSCNTARYTFEPLSYKGCIDIVSI
ncbi:hypothetical protein [Hymenobacter arizonensis]|nr:hypothetical protein [Hymenobacter arizonensis]